MDAANFEQVVEAMYAVAMRDVHRGDPQCLRALERLVPEVRRVVGEGGDHSPDAGTMIEAQAQGGGEVDRWNVPPCIECGAVDAKDAETKCICSGDKDDCHGVALWPDVDTAPPSAPAGVEGLHPETADLVRRFAQAVAEKLAIAERKYGWGTHWKSPAWMDQCREQLVAHVAKGDQLDVAAYAAFLWHHDEPTAFAQQPASAAEIRAVQRAREFLARSDASEEEGDAFTAGWYECETSLAQQPAAVAELPLNDATRNILGRMCFTFIRLANTLRLMGYEIPSRAEDEQAVCLHWLLNHYLRHGDEWADAADAEIAAFAAQRAALTQPQGGAK